MPIPVKLDEKRVIALHNVGIPVYIICQRFECSAARIRAVLKRNGLDTKVAISRFIEIPGGGITRRYGHKAGLGD